MEKAIECRFCSSCNKNIKHRHKKAIYCEECAIAIDKIKNNERQRRFREKNREKLRIKQREWKKKNLLRYKEITKKYVSKHNKERVEYNRKYRKNHPEWYKKKMKESNERRKEYKKQQKEMNLFFKKSYIVIAGVGCINCGEFTSGPRHKKYCEDCLKEKKEAKELNLTKEEKKEKYQSQYEVVVGVSCVVCGEFTPGNAARKFCNDCKTKWQISISQKTKEEIASWPSFKKMPDKLLRWKRIMDIRKNTGYCIIK